jgi:hypothetical protein
MKAKTPLKVLVFLCRSIVGDMWVVGSLEGENLDVSLTMHRR